MSERRFVRWLLLIGGVGLILRVLYAFALVRSRPLLGDALEFHLQANLLADGHGYIQPGVFSATGIARPSADKPPLYPLLEAGVSLLGGRSWQAHHLVGIACGTGTVIVTGLLGRRLATPRIGLIAGAVAAVYPLLVATDGSLRSESLFALLVTLALLLAVRLRAAPSVRRAAELGVVVALASLTRSEGLLLLALPVLALGRPPRVSLRLPAITAAICVVVLIPWFIRCLIAFDRPVPLSTNSGGLIAGANCRQTYAGNLIGQWTFACVPHPRYTNEALESARLRRIGVRYARAHAGRLPLVLAARVGRSFELVRPAQQAREEAFFEGRNLPVERAGVIVYYLVALLALRGSFALRRRRPEWLVLVVPFVMVVVVSLVGYGFTRFRAAAEPALIVLAAVSVDNMARRLGRRARIAQRWRGRRRRRGSRKPSRSRSEPAATGRARAKAQATVSPLHARSSVSR